MIASSGASLWELPAGRFLGQSIKLEILMSLPPYQCKQIPNRHDAPVAPQKSSVSDPSIDMAGTTVIRLVLEGGFLAWYWKVRHFFLSKHGNASFLDFALF
jgi:hypothetical protein